MLTIRISRLLEVKLGRKVPPRPIVAGEPLLTVRLLLIREVVTT